MGCPDFHRMMEAVSGWYYIFTVCNTRLFFIDPFGTACYTSRLGWGCSSAGRARRSQCRGQGFDPPHLHFFYFRVHHMAAKRLNACHRYKKPEK